jgi:hypothetical protein
MCIASRQISASANLDRGLGNSTALRAGVEGGPELLPAAHRIDEGLVESSGIRVQGSGFVIYGLGFIVEG